MGVRVVLLQPTPFRRPSRQGEKGRKTPNKQTNKFTSKKSERRVSGWKDEGTMGQGAGVREALHPLSVEEAGAGAREEKGGPLFSLSLPSLHPSSRTSSCWPGWLYTPGQSRPLPWTSSVQRHWPWLQQQGLPHRPSYPGRSERPGTGQRRRYWRPPAGRTGPAPRRGGRRPWGSSGWRFPWS